MIAITSSDPTKAAPTIGSDLREIGLRRHGGAGEDAGVRRQIVAVAARRRLAVAGEIGFQQLALRGGLALQRAQLDFLFAGARRLRPSACSGRRQAASRAAARRLGLRARAPCSTFCASVRICRSRSASCERSARMRGWLSSSVVERSAMSALSCTCRSRRRWISARRQHFRQRVERGAAFQQRAHARGVGFGGAAIGADARQFGRQFRQLLRRQHRIVLADQQVRLRAEARRPWPRLP